MVSSSCISLTISLYSLCVQCFLYWISVIPPVFWIGCASRSLGVAISRMISVLDLELEALGEGLTSGSR